MRELSEAEINELVGGGVNHTHFHEERPTHVTIEQLQDQMRIVQTNIDYLASSLDDIIICNTNTNDVTISLPASYGQKEYTLTNTAASGTVHVQFLGGATCHGSSTWSITGLGTVVRFKAFLGNWITV